MRNLALQTTSPDFRYFTSPTTYLSVTGWIKLDRDYIIQSSMYKKVESFVGSKVQ